MKVITKCHNYTGCVRAYKGEEIELDSGAALVCPECGKAVVMGAGMLKTDVSYDDIIDMSFVESVRDKKTPVVTGEAAKAALDLAFEITRQVQQSK